MRFALLLLFSLTCLAIDVPPLTGPVVDRASLLTSSQKAQLEEIALRIQASGKAQLAILVTDSLQDTDIESYAVAVFEKWKLGKKDKKDGLLFVIAPREKRVRIEVGYGLEGDIPDAVAKRILANHVTPFFKQGKFAEGILSGATEIEKRLSGVVSEEPPPQVEPPPRRKQTLPILPLLIFAMIMLFSQFGRRGGGGRGGGGFWYMGGGGGGWGGGSGGGGGFSGGGGSSGGGGASDSW